MNKHLMLERIKKLEKALMLLILSEEYFKIGYNQLAKLSAIDALKLLKIKQSDTPLIPLLEAAIAKRNNQL